MEKTPDLDQNPNPANIVDYIDNEYKKQHQGNIGDALPPSIAEGVQAAWDQDDKKRSEFGVRLNEDPNDYSSVEPTREDLNDLRRSKAAVADMKWLTNASKLAGQGIVPDSIEEFNEARSSAAAFAAQRDCRKELAVAMERQGIDPTAGPLPSAPTDSNSTEIIAYLKSEYDKSYNSNIDDDLPPSVAQGVEDVWAQDDQARAQLGVKLNENHDDFTSLEPTAKDLEEMRRFKASIADREWLSQTGQAADNGTFHSSIEDLNAARSMAARAQATRNCREELTAAMSRQGIDPKSPAVSDAIPSVDQQLRHAAMLGDNHSVQEFLEMGANPMSRDPETGVSALDHAVGSGDFAMTHMAYSYATSGAKKGLWDAPNPSALMEQAGQHGHNKIRDYLSQFAPVARPATRLSMASWDSAQSPLVAPAPSRGHKLQ